MGHLGLKRMVHILGRAGLRDELLARAVQIPVNSQSYALIFCLGQAPENNRGVWAKSVEKAVRKYVMRAQGDVYVITGPYYAGGVSADPAMQRVWVPSALYKLVYDASAKKAWAYWVENSNDARLNGTISYEELVKRTGIQFLSL